MTGTVLGGAPTLSPASAATCDTAFPVADLVAHQAVHGLTVSSGTTPEPFTGEVLGVLSNGIQPGVDMIMMRLTSPEIDRVGGIWAGMSGSPVYAADGRLIGAVAYGMAWGSSPVAGVTPFDSMDDYLSPALATAKIKVGKAAAQKIAASSSVTVSQAEQGFTRLPLSGGVSGLSQSQLDKVNTRNKRYLDKTERAASVGTSSAATAADLVNGGNVSFSVSNGDINIAGTGTVTSVCGSRLVAFGHPATYRGKVTAGLSPASVVYVQEDPVGFPFKLSNIAPPVGTITDDHLTGITGEVGTAPTGTSITSKATYGTRMREGTTTAYMSIYDARTALYQLYYNQDTVLDHYGPGSESASWTITGTKPDGSAFTIDLGDRYVSNYDIAFDAVWDVPDIVYELTSYKGVTITSINHDATFADSTDSWKLTGVEIKQGPVWVRTGTGVPIVAKAGSTLKARALIESTTGATKKVALNAAIPAGTAGARVYLKIAGGDSSWNSFYSSNTLDGLLTNLSKWVRNDQIVMSGSGGGSGGGTCKAARGCRGGAGSVKIQTTSPSQSLVVEGRRYFTVRIQP